VRSSFFTSLYKGAYVVAFCGTQGVGKTTLCRAIKKFVEEKEPNVEVHILSFADPLREMAASIFGDEWASDSKKHGIKDGPALRFCLPMISPDFLYSKDLKPELRTLTYRETLCKLGPALQSAFGEDLFANAMGDKIDRIHRDAQARREKVLILIDDLRKKVESDELVHGALRTRTPTQIVHLERLHLPNSADYYDCMKNAITINIEGFYQAPVSDLNLSPNGEHLIDGVLLDIQFLNKWDSVTQ
jgi:energy-coupling factor transporter ATP-binding protein EcfA2